MGESLKVYSPLTFAFLGDTVYSFYVCDYLVRKGNMQTAKLHKKMSSIVKAPAQAAALDIVSEILSDDEREAVNRGLNSKPEHHAKNASLYEYRKATALEALFGYLQLEGRTERIRELVTLCIKASETE
ncbi:MAG: ribonuclease III [Lachnospiraceae bacterium]|nr:ribonuclease III [Lachnospiraceae bacterium]